MLINLDLIKNPLNWLTVILMLLIAFIIFSLATKCTKQHFFKTANEE